jgi:hypothetical protein
MPNITVTVDESVYTNARIAAAVYNTTVTQLVRTFLEDLNRQTARFLASGCSGRAASSHGMASALNSTPKMPDLDSKRG